MNHNLLARTRERDRKLAFGLMALYLAISIFLIIYQFLRQDYFYAVRGFLFPLFFLIPPVFRLFKLQHPWRLYIVLYLFIIFAFSYGCIYGAFGDDLVIDKVSHFISGFVFTIIGFCFYGWLTGPKRDELHAPTAAAVSWAAGFSCFIALFWEVLEFLDYNVLGNDSQNHLTTGVFDTMYDLIFALLATVISALFFVLWKKKGIKLLTGWVVEEFWAVNGGA